MIFLDLGNQPFANEYLKKINQKEKKYSLKIDFNRKNKIVSIKKKFLSNQIFKKDYPYRSSISETMKKSFFELAKKIKKKFKKKKILEIGCNDGVFLKHFNQNLSLGIEPCIGIANIARKKKLNVISKYWNFDLAKKIKKKYNNFEIIFSANTITHIKNYNEVFSSVNHLLGDDGIFIIQDPSLLSLLKTNAYDQFYNEHIYVFSYLSLKNILKKHNLEIFDLENINVHGGSIRYYIQKKNGIYKKRKSIFLQEKKEIEYGLSKISTYKKFRDRVNHSKNELVKILKKFKDENKTVIGYGATAKAVTVLNYCKINSKYIEYFVDTTPEKQNKFMPGVKIKVKKYKFLNRKKVDYAFLGAWNFKEEILKKENKYLKMGGKFITHIPTPRIIS
ncbi:class I SAM-dependent methyltransferase [Candidatus Pelagibacter sp.]|nr:class I SAM-dependent methyltransferase [Candidatus Pelagibacter sp.]